MKKIYFIILIVCSFFCNGSYAEVMKQDYKDISFFMGPPSGKLFSNIEQTAKKNDVQFFDVYEFFLKRELEDRKIINELLSSLLELEVDTQEIFFTYYAVTYPTEQFDIDKFKIGDEKMIKIPVVMIFPDKLVGRDGLPVQKNISEEVVNGISSGLGLIFKLDWVRSSAVLAE